MFLDCHIKISHKNVYIFKSNFPNNEIGLMNPRFLGIQVTYSQFVGLKFSTSYPLTNKYLSNGARRHDCQDVQGERFVNKS